MTKRATLLSLLTLLSFSQMALADSDVIGTCPQADSIVQENITFQLTETFDRAKIVHHKEGFAVQCFYGTGQHSVLLAAKLPEKYTNTQYKCALVKGTKASSSCKGTAEECVIKCKS